MTVRTNADVNESFHAAGNIFTLIEDGEATGGALAVFETELGPGWPGPPQHIHYGQDETFYVISGSVDVTSGDHTFRADAGTMVTIPKGDPHTFGNANADVPARLLCTVAPARNFDYFRELAGVPTTADGRLDVGALQAFMRDWATKPYIAA
jgi:mannose-6-phosphate isomerase-like protein (cupin superfamily)